MVDIAVGITPFVAGTISADVITAAANIESVAAGEYAVIDADGDTSDLVISAYSAGAFTLTLIEGANPPSMNAELGNGSAQSGGAGDVCLITMPGGQYVQANGTVRVLVGTNTTIIGAFRMAREQ
jgi:hypothetical protein